ncbi:WhiB family transcriptional regulator [Rhodococcoides kyotonense]|uniref:WhiB family transcriptional regulator n=1 Tax=Rhodococcoides kyotonense TaxID=398843 RepID=UPI000B781FDB|nr:WhiB family transcriptional regulator [Rhodococcus kyotonensis]
MRNQFKAIQLPNPVAENWDWQLNASCRDVGVEAYFPPVGLRGSSLLRFELDAKAPCNGCPVLARCRQYALQGGEPYGIWGGLTARERSEILRQPASRSGESRSLPEKTSHHRIGPPKRFYIKRIREHHT